MTRRDFVAIAHALNRAYRASVGTTAAEGARAAIWEVCDALEMDHPRFDREKFLAYAFDTTPEKIHVNR